MVVHSQNMSRESLTLVKIDVLGIKQNLQKCIARTSGAAPPNQISGQYKLEADISKIYRAKM